MRCWFPLRVRRFTEAGLLARFPTPAVVSTPRRRMFSPPITSALADVRHLTHLKSACFSLLLASTCPQAGHVGLVWAAGTLMNCRPYQRDLYSGFWVMAAQQRWTSWFLS